MEVQACLATSSAGRPPSFPGNARGAVSDPSSDVDFPTPTGTTRCARDEVTAAALAAFAGGAQGIVLRRTYSEMRLDYLAGAGDAMKELGG